MSVKTLLETKVPSIPPGQSCDKLVEKLIDTINDTGKQAITIILTFLVTVVYIAVTALATTDSQLFLNAPVTLPLFNVGVPMRYFFGLAPWIVVLLHINLLLQEYVLAYRIYRLPSETRKSINDADRFFLLPSIIMRLPGKQNPLATFLLRLIFLATTVALPVLVLIVLQGTFLPSHEPSITDAHRDAVLIDLIMVWAFFLFRPRPEKDDHNLAPEERSREHKHRVLWPLEIAVFLVLSVLTLWYSNEAMVIPTGCQATSADAWMFGHRSLVLRDKLFALQTPSLELRVAPASSDLRCADFSGSHLVNADFRGADLTGARFKSAWLQGADFSPLQASGAQASAHESDISGFRSSILTGVDFTDADLREAKLRFAKLSQARLDDADLRAADLSFSNLNEATLSRARLTAADLRSASLRGAILQGAELQAANLRIAVAEFSSFVGADLKGADFTGAKMEGGDFENTMLEGSSNLALQGVNLYGASLGHVSFCEDTQRPRFVDLRYIRAETPRQAGYLDRLTEGLSKDVANRIREKLDHWAQVATCILKQPPTNDPSILFVMDHADGDVGTGWTKSDSDERSFYDGLAAYLLDEVVCKRGEEVQKALLQRLTERIIADRQDLSARGLARSLAKRIQNPGCISKVELSPYLQNIVLQEALSSE